MIINTLKFKMFLVVIFSFVLFGSVAVFAEEVAKEYVTTTRVNFRTAGSTDSAVIATLDSGTSINVTLLTEADWSTVSYNGVSGYIKSEYITLKGNYIAEQNSNVELLEWSEAKSVFTTGVDAKIYDVRTGLIYYVRSFSNGLHADVEPVTKEDTATMLKTYGGRWEWDPRPVFVTINGRTMAASINGMPHGGGVNANNGMNGQVCIHFRGSRTHNGNAAFTRDHQDGITEAWNAR